MTPPNGAITRSSDTARARDGSSQFTTVTAAWPRSAAFAVVALSLLLLLLLVPAARAASGEVSAWQRIYGSPSHSNARVRPGAGARPAERMSSEYAHHRPSGWSRAMTPLGSGSGCAYDDGPGGRDLHATARPPTRAATDRGGTANNAKIIVAKYSPAREASVGRVYDDPASSEEEAMYATDVVGNVYATGYTTSAVSGSDVAPHQVLSAGKRRWFGTTHTANQDRPASSPWTALACVRGRRQSYIPWL